MTQLSVLQNRDHNEIQRILAAATNTLLPQPNDKNLVADFGTDLETVNSTIQEIRKELGISENDYSYEASSKIIAYLSNEMSKIVFTGVNLNIVKARLGNKGELHPSKYKVEIDPKTVFGVEMLGESKNNLLEIVSTPHKVKHLRTTYSSYSDRVGVTISIKFVTGRSLEKRFFIIVISFREGYLQRTIASFRAYLSELNLNETSDPIQILKAFVDKYGLIFSFGEKKSKLMINEQVNFPRGTNIENKHLKVFHEKNSTPYIEVIFGIDLSLSGPDNSEMGEVILAFAINADEYLETLRKQNVKLASDIKKHFPRTLPF